MYQKIELQQLTGYNLDKIKEYKQTLVDRKTELEAIKTKGGKAWTPELQEEIDEIALLLVDVNELIEDKQKAKKEAKPKDEYVVKPGTEKLVHLIIVKGRRFSPTTGKEESFPYRQLFSHSEWQLFKDNHKRLGYSIVKVLYDPYSEAAEFVIKN